MFVQVPNNAVGYLFINYFTKMDPHYQYCDAKCIITIVEITDYYTEISCEYCTFVLYLVFYFLFLKELLLLFHKH